MKICRDLAKFIADHAVSEPYRQSDALDTQMFAGWLAKRSIHLDWRSIHHLAVVGVLHPVAVLSIDAIDGPGDRLIPHSLGEGVNVHVDLGHQVSEAMLEPLPGFDSVPPHVRNALIWHPFQLWEIDRVARILKPPIALDASLYGASSHGRLVGSFHDKLRSRLTQLANSNEHSDFLKVLGVLLAVEPLVITQVDTKIRLNSWPSGERLEDYFTWCGSIDGAGILDEVGLSVATVVEWHAKLAAQAQLADPNERWRALTRYVPRDQRLRLKDKALMAEDLYYAAELLRRYLERYHQRHDLPEEDDVIYGAQSSDVKQRIYGNKRITDFDRSVFRQVVRQFHLDPQPRLRWLVEGKTEEAFLLRLAEREHIDLGQWGIQIIDLHGLSGLGSVWTKSLLAICREEEVFASVSVDHDGHKYYEDLLRQYAAEDLLPGGFTVFKPNFEEANFSAAELASIGTAIPARHGVQVLIFADDLSREMSAGNCGARSAVFKLWKRARFWKRDTKEWGRALADLAYEEPAPIQSENGEGKREVISLFRRQLRARTSNYKFTIEREHTNDEGQVVPRQAVT